MANYGNVNTCCHSLRVCLRCSQLRHVTVAGLRGSSHSFDICPSLLLVVSSVLRARLIRYIPAVATSSGWLVRAIFDKVSNCLKSVQEPYAGPRLLALATVLALNTGCRSWFRTLSRSVTGLSISSEFISVRKPLSNLPAITTCKTILSWFLAVTSTMSGLFTVDAFDSSNLALQLLLRTAFGNVAKLYLLCQLD